MARSRNIKPGFFTNDVLGELPALTRLLFAGIWTLCDREGRLEDRPKKIRAEVLPYDVCDPEAMLQDLEKHGFILRYTVGGIKAIQVVAWDKHQNPHVKEAPSTIPAPDKHGASTVQVPDEQSPEPERAGLIPSSLIPDSSLLIPDSLEGERAQAPAKPPRGSKRCPADFVVTDEMQAWADENFPAVDLNAAVDKFRDHTFTKSITDWTATLRNWIRKEAEFKPARKPAAATASFADHDEQKRRRRWEEMTGRKWPTDGDVIDITPDQQRISA